MDFIVHPEVMRRAILV